MRRGIGIGGLAVAGLLFGGCALDEQAGGIASVMSEGAGDGGYWVHEHLHNLGLRSGPFETSEEAAEVAQEHNFLYHMSTRAAYVSERSDGLDSWKRGELLAQSPWDLINRPRDLPNAG